MDEAIDLYTAAVFDWANANPGLLILASIVLVVIGVILGMGERRKVIVFRNYDDLFMTFLMPILAVGGLIGLAGSGDGGGGILPVLGLAACIASLSILVLVTFRTLTSNNYVLWKFLIAMLVKFPLALIWVLQLISLIRPGGETGRARAQSRANALLILFFLTPIVAALVVEKKGVFSPRQVLKGRRIGSIRHPL